MYEEFTGKEMQVSKYLNDFVKYLTRDDLVLVAPSGTGEDALELARRGFDVVGLSSGSDVSKANRNARLGNIAAKFETGDASKYKDGMFDAVLCLKFDISQVADLARVLTNGGALYAVMPLTRQDVVLSKFNKYFKVLKESDVLVGKKK